MRGASRATSHESNVAIDSVRSTCMTPSPASLALSVARSPHPISSHRMSERPPLTPDIFDTEFHAAERSEWTRRVIGAALPAEVDPFSFITLEGLHQIAASLAACRGETLVDL